MFDLNKNPEASNVNVLLFFLWFENNLFCVKMRQHQIDNAFIW